MYTDKNELRKAMLKLRSQMDEQEYEMSAGAIYRRVMALPEYRQNSSILCYASCRREADTMRIIRAALQSGRTVALPKVTGPMEMIFLKIYSLDELQPGFMGIPEPKDDCREEITEGLLIVPGTAFDRQMHRMGYGGGYYDTWLDRYGMSVTACGLAHDFQMLPDIPCEPHDRSMDLVVTPMMTYRRGEMEDDN